MKLLLILMSFIGAPAAFASATVKIGTADNEIQIDKTGGEHVSPELRTATEFDVIRKSKFPYLNHGTQSFLTIFQGLGPEFQLSSVANVGYYPTLENTGEGNRYKINGRDVFVKMDGGLRFFQTHILAGTQVIYLGWPLNAGNAIIKDKYLRAFAAAGVILVEVAPRLDPTREFKIGEDDKYSLLVGALDEEGFVMRSSRLEGVDIFCPGFVELSNGTVFYDTSAAAAVCTRYVAQMLALKPALTLPQIRQILTETGKPAPAGASAKIADIEKALEYLRTH